MVSFVTCLTDQHLRVIPRFPAETGHITGPSLPLFLILKTVLCPRLPSYPHILTCSLGTLCIQGTASQHAFGQSGQCPGKPHDSDAHSWYRRTGHTIPLAPHTLHNELPLQLEGTENTGQLWIPCRAQHSAVYIIGIPWTKMNK